MTRPSASAFFERRPALLLPLADLLFVALVSTYQWLLRTPTTSTHQFRDVMFMIVHTKFASDHIGNSLACPQLAREAKRFRPLPQHPQQLLPLLWLEFGRRSARSPFLQPGEALRFSHSHDLASPPLAEAQRFVDR